jgi:peptidyl-dipeptidase A
VLEYTIIDRSATVLHCEYVSISHCLLDSWLILGTTVTRSVSSLSQIKQKSMNFFFKTTVVYLLILSIFICVSCKAYAASSQEVDAFLRVAQTQLESGHVEAALKEWAYNTDLTPENKHARIEADAKLANLNLGIAANATKFSSFAASLPPDDPQRRMLNKIKHNVDDTPADATDRDKLEQILADMEGLYSTTRVDGKHLDPELEEILANSRNAAELFQAWDGWHTAAGKAVREKYAQFVPLSNSGSKSQGFQDTAAAWITRYGPDPLGFEASIDHLWDQVRPLYEELHCYVRSKLVAKYGEDHVPKDGLIPAHLLGNMWAQTWQNIFDIVAPYPNAASVDITGDLVAANYNATGMFRLAEEFYMSLGFKKLPDSFWTNSMIVRPPDRDVVCHGSAWDFYGRGADHDMRIKMCTKVEEEDLFTIHHELGHIFYYQAYENQDFLFRRGANNGFHEAIGDTTRLSMTIEHLARVGLVDQKEADQLSQDPEFLLNAQMQTALQKIAFLPFALVIDKWRWAVFRGQVTPENYNDYWWKLRQHYQGIGFSGANKRLDTDGFFDPGAKFHVPNNTPYIRYFVAHVLQFQFHRSMCGNTPPQSCSIYGNAQAGQSFRAMMELGASKPWPQALELISGSPHMDASAILEYFAPLHEWLQQQNKGSQCGWPDATGLIPDPEGHAPPFAFLYTALLVSVVVLVMIVAYRMYKYGSLCGRHGANAAAELEFQQFGLVDSDYDEDEDPFTADISGYYDDDDRDGL